MASQQAHQTEIGAQVFGAKEVFVAESGVVSNRYAVGIQLRARQNPRVKAFDFHLPAKRSFQVCRQVSMTAMSPDKQRHPNLQGDDGGDNRQRGFPPLLQLVHAAGKFRRLIRKKVEAGESPGQTKECSRRLRPFNPRIKFLVHGMEHAAPTRPRRQVHECFKNAYQS